MKKVSPTKSAEIEDREAMFYHNSDVAVLDVSLEEGPKYDGPSMILGPVALLHLQTPSRKPPSWGYLLLPPAAVFP